MIKDILLVFVAILYIILVIKVIVTLAYQLYKHHRDAKAQ